nr:uncharacterized protein LOC127337051 isoform X2 [Lolium perenne]
MEGASASAAPFGGGRRAAEHGEARARAPEQATRVRRQLPPAATAATRFLAWVYDIMGDLPSGSEGVPMEDDALFQLQGWHSSVRTFSSRQTPCSN